MVAEAGNGGNGKVNNGQVQGAFRRIFAAMRSNQPLKGVREGPPPPPDAELPPDNFLEGWTAERALRAIMGQEASMREITHLGPYIEANKNNTDNQDSVLKLSGKQHVVAFPENLVILFASLDQDRIDALGKVADWTPQIVNTLHTLAQREIERVIKRQLWSRAWKATGAGAVLAFGVAKWGWEVWLWLSSNFPIKMAEVATWLSGS